MSDLKFKKAKKHTADIDTSVKETVIEDTYLEEDGLDPFNVYVEYVSICSNGGLYVVELSAFDLLISPESITTIYDYTYNYFNVYTGSMICLNRATFLAMADEICNNEVLKSLYENNEIFIAVKYNIAEKAFKLPNFKELSLIKEQIKYKLLYNV